MLQWTPLLLVVSMFTCENTRSVALGLLSLGIEIYMNKDRHFIIKLLVCTVKLPSVIAMEVYQIVVQNMAP